jgi:hypothetical protein
MAVPAPSKASVPSPAPKPPKPGIDIFTQLHGQKLGYRSWYILIWWVKIHFFYRFGGSYIYNIYIYIICVRIEMMCIYNHLQIEMIVFAVAVRC